MRVMLILEWSEAVGAGGAAGRRVAFEVDGRWLEDQAVEREVSRGTSTEQLAVLPSWPTRVRLTAPRGHVERQAVPSDLLRAELRHLPSQRSLALLGPCLGGGCPPSALKNPLRTRAHDVDGVFRVPPLHCVEADEAPGCEGDFAAMGWEVLGVPRRASANATLPNATTSILVSFAVHGVDFAALDAAATLHASFAEAIVATLASEAGVNQSLGSAHLSASQGAVLAQVALDLPADVGAAAVQTRLRAASPSLQTSLASAVKSLPGISAAAARGAIVSVGALELREMTATRGAETQEPLALSAFCGNFSCPSGMEMRDANTTCRTTACTSAECCSGAGSGTPAPPREEAAGGHVTAPSCRLPLGELGWGVPCQHLDAGNGFVLYSMQRLNDRFGMAALVMGAAERLACVRFRQGAWQYSSDGAWQPFLPLQTDVLVAEVDFSRGSASDLRGVQDFHEGIAKGYTLGSVELRPMGWRGPPEGSGRFMATGSYIALDSCRGGPPGERGSGSGAWTPCEFVAGISCHLQRPVLILTVLLFLGCLLCCFCKFFQVRLSKQKKFELPDVQARSPSDPCKADGGVWKLGGGEGIKQDVLKVDGVVPNTGNAPKEMADEAWAATDDAHVEEGRRVQEMLQDDVDAAPDVECVRLPQAEAGHRAPVVLRVLSPNQQSACSGEYELLLGEIANGSPVWQKRQSCRWLYTGLDGKWYVGGAMSRRHNFLCASGFLCSSEPHGGRLPDSMAGAWEVGDGKGWQKDRDVTVTSLAAPQPVVRLAQASERSLALLAIEGGKKIQAPSESSTRRGSDSGPIDDKSPCSSSGKSMSSSLGDDNSVSLGTPSESLCEQPVGAASPPPSPSASDASEVAAPETVPGVPQVVHVESPNGQSVCAGRYDLVPATTPNGMPMWKQHGGDHYIYSSKARRWCIGGQDIADRGFEANAGWLYQGRDHGGLPPNQSTSPWLRWNGGGFEVDLAIRVRSQAQLAAEEKQVKRQKDREADDASRHWKAQRFLPPPPLGPSEEGGPGLDVVLECTHAGGMDTQALDPQRRSVAKLLEAGVPFAVGPSQQPEVFGSLMRGGAAGFSEDLLKLIWQPPCLYARRAAQGAMLLVNGQVVQSESALLQHGCEVSVCAHGAKEELPVFTFRVLTDPAGVQHLRQAAPASSGTVLDLRGRRLSTKERRAMCGLSKDATRIVI